MEIKVDSEKLASVLDLFASDGMDKDMTPELKYLHDLVRQAHAKLAVVRIDETKNWNLTGPKPETIWGVYLVDMNEHTYCCELTPSLYLRFMYNNYSGSEVNTEIEDYETTDDQNIYVHVREFPAADIHVIDQDNTDLSDTYDEFMESWMEFCNANHHF